MKAGWIKLHRKLLDSEIWNKREPFDARSAWIDLLLMANYEDKEIFFDGEMIKVKRGQIVTSISKLSKRWGWSRDKVKRFLDSTDKSTMLTRNSTTHKTTITLVNYGFYQDWVSTDKSTDKSTYKSTDKTQTIIYKNIKKERSAPLVDDDYDESFEMLMKKIGGEE